LTDGIDEETAEESLRQDVKAAERVVLRLIRIPLHDGPFEALVCFTFNLGPGARQRSTLGHQVDRGVRVLPAARRRVQRGAIFRDCQAIGASLTT
jgi:GH24 family phage-related lysozyme (muramidase)